MLDSFKIGRINSLNDSKLIDYSYPNSEESEEMSAENPVFESNSSVTTENNDSQCPVSKDVLTPEDVKALAPYYANVVMAIKQVYDPEIPVNIYDLGLIYDIVINKEHEVFITMTFTAPNCPMADDVMLELRKVVEDVPGIESCFIDLVFEPAWDQSMLSEEARIELGLD